MAFLTDVTGATRRTYKLGESTTLGRDADNAVTLSDPRVSRKHALIRRLPDGPWVLTDLGSSHGTYVGDKRVSLVVLAPGDVIRLGETRLRFDLEEGAAALVPDAGRRLAAVPDAQFAPERQIADGAQLRRDYEKLRVTYELVRSIGVEHDLDVLLQRILDAAFHLLAADRGAILIVDPATGHPEVRIRRSRSGKSGEVALSRTMIDQVIAERRGFISGDAGLDERFNRAASIAGLHIRSAMTVPMLHGDELVGIMHLDSQVSANVFGDQDLELFTSIASQAALTIKNAMLRARVDAVTAEERRRLDLVVRGLPTGVLLLDGRRRIVVANPSARELLPLLTTAGVGDVLDRLGPLPVEALLAARGRSPLDVELPGPARALVVSVVGSGHSDETVVVLRDVTEERERERRSAHAERMALVGQLAGGIAHDFNNLLCVIKTHADFVADEVVDPTPREDLAAIRAASDRAVHLTRQLLAFSRRQAIKPRVIDLNQAVTEVELMLRRTLGETVELSSSLAPNLWPVTFDPGEIDQVLMNLAVNARDAMPDGGHLVVRTSNLVLEAPVARGGEELPAGRYVVLSVTDTGVGMSREVASRIFEPFFTTKEKGKGTGLGLATVYGIVKRARGYIVVDTEPGRGTTFTLYLPASDGDRAASGEHAPAPTHARNRERVLVVEDEAGVRALACRILAREGYQVLEAGDGVEALEVCEQRGGAVDAVLSDMIMPRMSGKELRRRLHARWPSVRVLFMSGYAGTEGDSLDDGELEVVAKPFEQAVLLGQLRALLDA